jgi:hypothetical protein
MIALGSEGWPRALYRRQNARDGRQIRSTKPYMPPAFDETHLSPTLMPNAAVAP